MTETPTTKRPISAAVVVTIAMLVLASFAFFAVLILFSPTNVGGAVGAPSERYIEIADRLLIVGDPAQAEAALERHACIACHRLGGERVAPPWGEALVAAAGERRPPLTAAEYVYEAIVHPNVHIVDGYPASMPQDYGTRMTEQEIADVMAYLLNGGM